MSDATRTLWCCLHFIMYHLITLLIAPTDIQIKLTSLRFFDRPMGQEQLQLLSHLGASQCFAINFLNICCIIHLLKTVAAFGSVIGDAASWATKTFSILPVTALLKYAVTCLLELLASIVCLCLVLYSLYSSEQSPCTVLNLLFHMVHSTIPLFLWVLFSKWKFQQTYLFLFPCLAYVKIF